MTTSGGVAPVAARSGQRLLTPVSLSSGGNPNCRCSGGFESYCHVLAPLDTGTRTRLMSSRITHELQQEEAG